MSAILVEELSKTFLVRQAQSPAHSEDAPVQKRFSLLRRRVVQQVEKVALAPTSFVVEKGESVAFIGPNGAGKSTTIKMLTGILHPSQGKAQVLGLTPWKERERLSRSIGTVFGQKSQLWYHLPAADTFTLMSHVYDIKRAEFVARQTELVRAFGLEHLMGIPVRKLSLGERMRAEIALALLHRPAILFLDEPTIGLDVVVKRTIRELISRLHKEEGVTVFLTSHDPGDMETLCQRALVIDRGELLFDDSLERLKRNYMRYKTIHLKLVTEQLEPVSFELQGVLVERLEAGVLLLHVDLNTQRVETVLAAAMQCFAIEDVTIESPKLEDAIAAMYLATKERRGAG